MNTSSEQLLDDELVSRQRFQGGLSEILEQGDDELSVRISDHGRYKSTQKSNQPDGSGVLGTARQCYGQEHTFLGSRQDLMTGWPW